MIKYWAAIWACVARECRLGTYIPRHVHLGMYLGSSAAPSKSEALVLQGNETLEENTTTRHKSRVRVVTPFPLHFLRQDVFNSIMKDLESIAWRVLELSRLAARLTCIRAPLMQAWNPPLPRSGGTLRDIIE